MNKVDKSKMTESELRKHKRKKRQIITTVLTVLLLIAVVLGSVLPIVLGK